MQQSAKCHSFVWIKWRKRGEGNDEAIHWLGGDCYAENATAALASERVESWAGSSMMQPAWSRNMR